MMLIGHIAKQEGPFWSADIDEIGAHTQGTSRHGAVDMLVRLVELMIEREGFRVLATETGRMKDGAFDVLVTANEPFVLAARVLRYQRERHKLTLADVAKRLGASSINAYAAYEQGKREPTLSKYLELLHAVAPEMVLTVGSVAILKPKLHSVATAVSTKKGASRAAERGRAAIPAKGGGGL